MSQTWLCITGMKKMDSVLASISPLTKELQSDRFIKRTTRSHHMFTEAVFGTLAWIPSSITEDNIDFSCMVKLHNTKQQQRCPAFESFPKHFNQHRRRRRGDCYSSVCTLVQASWKACHVANDLRVLICAHFNQCVSFLMEWETAVS